LTNVATALAFSLLNMHALRHQDNMAHRESTTTPFSIHHYSEQSFSNLGDRTHQKNLNHAEPTFISPQLPKLLPEDDHSPIVSITRSSQRISHQVRLARCRFELVLGLYIMNGTEKLIVYITLLVLLLATSFLLYYPLTILTRMAVIRPIAVDAIKDITESGLVSGTVAAFSSLYVNSTPSGTQNGHATVSWELLMN
jgi:hypothetical protein